MEGVHIHKGEHYYAQIFVGGRPVYHILQLHDSLSDRVVLSNIGYDRQELKISGKI
jgi:hypothetical protein